MNNHPTDTKPEPLSPLSDARDDHLAPMPSSPGPGPVPGLSPGPSPAPTSSTPATPSADASPEPAASTPASPAPASAAAQRFESCRWRKAAGAGIAAHCSHRDVKPMTGTDGFNPEAWCPDCAFFKLRRAPGASRKNDYY